MAVVVSSPVSHRLELGGVSHGSCTLRVGGKIGVAPWSDAETPANLPHTGYTDTDTAPPLVTALENCQRL